MAKIGTAHIELKPVLDEASLEAISAQVEAAVARGVARGMSWKGKPFIYPETNRANHFNHVHWAFGPTASENED